MSSSDGGSVNPALLLQAGSPMPNLPIAGSGPNIDPYNYGKFQNFLPDVPSQADFNNGVRAPSAQGLTKEMFTYRSPNGDVTPTPAAAPSIDYSGQLNDLRSQLAQLLAQRNQFGAAYSNPTIPYNYGDSFGGGAIGGLGPGSGDGPGDGGGTY